jgi:hypothetical protein
MDRREMIKLGAGVVVGGLTATGAKAVAGAPGDEQVDQWGVFEASAKGPVSGNPFVDVTFAAKFTQGHRTVEVQGFYDGNGVYKVRFSPDMAGRWTYETAGSAKELAGDSGAFTCMAAKAGNRGPVGTAHQYHFQYADGTPYFPFGTTCYAYGFIPEPFASQTLDGLKTAGFNKVRMCLLPKPLGTRKPVAMPFEHQGSALAENAENLADDSKSKEAFDLARLNPAYFQHVEQKIIELQAIGVEADVILFHPYDAWGFKAMPAEADDLYLRYAVARLSAYRNVWWSIANEYDLMKAKTMKDWDSFFRIVQESDPHSRLRSIHHSRVVYDHSKAWCTHASLQEYDFDKSAARLAAWNKPIIYDEIQYEGDISRRWGNLSAQEMTYRFWRAIAAGTYATHGETFNVPDGAPVWSDGGKLRGTSGARITWLRKLLEETKTTGLVAPDAPYYLNAANPGEVYLWFFDFHCVGEYEFPLPEKGKFKVTLVDPFAMTKTEVPGTFSGKSKIALTGKPYQAALVVKV